ncbi:MAG: ABC transporter permease, partial [Vicinamibacterales bacterium]
GIVFAQYASQAISRFLLQDYLVPTSLNVAPDGTVIAVAVAASMTIGLTMTIAAAWIVATSGFAVLVQGGGRSVARSWRVGRVLVGAQVAVSFVLLTHASLLGRSVYNIAAVESGVTADTVIVGYPSQRVGGYRRLDPAPYYQQALDRVKAVPGVAAAAFSRYKPEGGALPFEPVGHAGTPVGENDIAAEFPQVSPGFFETLGLSVVRGRDFTFADDAKGPRVAIISHHLARQLFGEGRGIGERIRISARPEWQDTMVVGIVSDARVYDVRRGNLSIVYAPALQTGDLAHYKCLLVRAPTAASRAVGQAIESLGVELMPRTQTLAYVRGRTILQERVMAGLGGYFGVLGLMLVAVGIYGLLSYVLSLRRKEIGIRMALGADACRVGRAILADGLRVTGIGVVLGLGAALFSARLLQTMLVNTNPHHPWAIVGVCCVLLAVTALASMAPAVRAAQVEPLSELRRD